MRAVALVLAAALASTIAQSDTECGNATLPLTPGRRNVLLVGDSISMVPPFTPGGYGGALEALLVSKGVVVQHAGGFYSGGQCSNTVKGLLCTNSSYPDNYLNVSGKFDVVHFNYGLHDLVAPCAANETGECEEHVALPTYGANLQTLYKRFQSVSTKVMWTTTTPCPNVTTSMGRTYESSVLYNKIALQSLQALAGSGLLVDDLWAAMINECGAYYQSCDLQLPANVHLSAKGIAFTAQVAFEAIMTVLAM